MPPKSTPLNIESKLFCPRRDCPCYQSLDNHITKDGVYTTKNDGVARQMFNCGKGKHRFSETVFCDLFGKHGSFKEHEQMCKMSCYGLSVDEIADVLLKDTRTIAAWQRSVSRKANLFHEVIGLSITLTVLFIQMDELWSYLKNKNNTLWVFIGFEVDSRFWLNFELGSRTTHRNQVGDTHKRLSWKAVPDNALEGDNLQAGRLQECTTNGLHRPHRLCVSTNR